MYEGERGRGAEGESMQQNGDYGHGMKRAQVKRSKRVEENVHPTDPMNHAQPKCPESSSPTASTRI